MLKKIIRIKNVGKFLNSEAPGNTSLAKHSLISAPNAQGKSTLCMILRSLNTGDAGYIIGRKTLGVTDLSIIEILTDSGVVRFDGKSWNKKIPNIAIFDSTFVKDNVHSGDTVDSEQKKNLYRVIVGKNGVSLAQEEAKLAKDSREKSTAVSKIEQAILPNTNGIKLNEFIALPKIDDIDKQIEAQERFLLTINEAASIKNRNDFIKIIIPELPSGFTEILSKTIDNISKDAEEQIKNHLIKTEMTESGESWIIEGMEHIDDNCPYCGQDINDVQLITAYKSVFSKTYRAFRSDISNIKAQIDKLTGTHVVTRFNTHIAEHNANLEFWKRYITLDESALQFPSSFLNAITDLHKASATLIEEKLRSPLEPIAITEAYSNAVSIYESEKAKVIAHNSAIESANLLIASKKTAIGTADTTEATNELQKLKATKIRHTSSLSTLCEQHTKLVKQKMEIDHNKANIRKSLDEYTHNVIAPYQARINQLLDAFNAEFLIAETKHNYAGGSATSSYQIVINKIPVDIGGNNTPHDVPSFKNTLSAGDRSTLAFAFFIAQIENDPELQNLIIAFDDPFNSQDSFRRRQTIHEIIKIGRKCKQVLVFSHDTTFLKQIWDKCAVSERASLALANHRRSGTKIIETDLEKACQGRTATDIDDLQSFYNFGTGSHLDIIRKMRTVLETYMRTTYPNNFNDKDYLGEIAGKIRNGGDTHPAWELYDEVNEINDYTSQYHHGEDLNDATPDTIDSVELAGFTKRTLRIVNAIQA